MHPSMPSYHVERAAPTFLYFWFWNAHPQDVLHFFVRMKYDHHCICALHALHSQPLIDLYRHLQSFVLMLTISNVPIFIIYVQTGKKALHIGTTLCHGRIGLEPSFSVCRLCKVSNWPFVITSGAPVLVCNLLWAVGSVRISICQFLWNSHVMMCASSPKIQRHYARVLCRSVQFIRMGF